jgi:DNA polymerase III epsilon subunit-like protein
MTDYSLWYENPFTVLDTETTGLGTHDRIVQLGIVRFEKGRVVDSWKGLVWSGIEIPAAATKIHGISTADIANAPPWITVIPKIINLTRGAVPAAYNADFDKRMILAEMRRVRAVNLDALHLPVFHERARWFDPLIWTRSVDRFSKEGNKLFQVCNRRNIPLLYAHDALSDATAAGKILWDMRHEIGDMTTSEMLRQQGILGDAQERRFAAWRWKQQGVPR